MDEPLDLRQDNCVPSPSLGNLYPPAGSVVNKVCLFAKLITSFLLRARIALGTILSLRSCLKGLAPIILSHYEVHLVEDHPAAVYIGLSVLNVFVVSL